MKIASAALQLESSHVKQQHHELRESLRAWIGDRRPNFEGRANQQPLQQSLPQPLPASDHVRLSNAGKAAQASETDTLQKNVDATDNDPVLGLIKAMVFMLTGREVKVFDPADLQVRSPAAEVPSPEQQPNNADAPPQNAGYGVEYDRHESYTESEQTSVQASGVVKTAVIRCSTMGRAVRYGARSKACCVGASSPSSGRAQIMPWSAMHTGSARVYCGTQAWSKAA